MGMTGRTVHPYDDTNVIDSRGPRTNQAVIGTLALVAFVVDAKWLVAVLALQLAVGLTAGRRFCLPCLFYFEVIQPRFGEGRIEDARPPRFANLVGVCFLGGATAAFLAGAPTVGWALTLVVAALALLAATTGLCMGCEAYLLLARMRGLKVERYPTTFHGRVDARDLGLPDEAGVAVVAFSTPYCLPCQEWESALGESGVGFKKIDLSERPELVRRYGISSTPLILAVQLPEGRILETHRDAPRNGEVERLRRLAAA
jgi:Domain of unknown function (DUF4395)